MARERYRYQVKCDYEEKTFFFDDERDANEKFEFFKKKYSDGVRLFELLERYSESDDEWFTIQENEIKNSNQEEN